MKKVGNILWGLVFIVVGVILGLNALEITKINLFFDGWWTLFIIVPCFIGIFREREKIANIIGCLVGVFLLLCCQKVWDFELMWRLLIPTVLIVIGLCFIFKDVVGGNVASEIKRLNSQRKGKNEYSATFSGQDINFNGQEFNGIDLIATFGGIKCDLRNAVINSDQVVNVSSTFGGVDVFVPSNVQVKIKSTSIFGGVSDRAAHTNQEGVPTIFTSPFAPTTNVSAELLTVIEYSPEEVL